VWLISSEVEWLKQYAEKDETGVWRCKTCNEPIRTAVVGRSIWIRPFNGGPGEVRRVTHLACLVCTPEKQPPRYGSPIYEDELVSGSP
jgi:hypothetical protein